MPLVLSDFLIRDNACRLIVIIASSVQIKLQQQAHEQD